VLIEIIDRNSKFVRVIHNGFLAEGIQKFEVNVSTLNGELFFYRITDSTGVKSKKILIAKK